MRKSLSLVVVESERGIEVQASESSFDGVQSVFDNLGEIPGSESGRASLICLDFESGECSYFLTKEFPLPPRDREWGYMLGSGPIVDPDKQFGSKGVE